MASRNSFQASAGLQNGSNVINSSNSRLFMGDSTPTTTGQASPTYLDPSAASRSSSRNVLTSPPQLQAALKTSFEATKPSFTRTSRTRTRSAFSKEVSERTSELWKSARQGNCSAMEKEGIGKGKRKGSALAERSVRNSSAGVAL